MDITTILQEMLMPVVMIGCFVVGYVVKNFMPTDTKWIPLFVTIVGIVLACWINMSIDPTTIVAGAISGIASTGVHQLVKETLGIKATKRVKK